MTARSPRRGDRRRVVRVSGAPGSVALTKSASDSAELIAQSSDPILPSRSADDSAEGWHESDDSNDDRLRRDVPPHW